MNRIALRTSLLAGVLGLGMSAACHHNASSDTTPTTVPPPAGDKMMLTDAGTIDGMVSGALDRNLEVAQAEPMAGDGGIGGMPRAPGTGSNVVPTPGPIATPNNPRSPGAPAVPSPTPAPGAPAPTGPTPPPSPTGPISPGGPTH